MSIHNMSSDAIVSCLKDIGCQQKDIDCFLDSYQKKDINKQILVLKRMRCHLSEITHQYQKKVDCLDYILCQIKNNKCKK